ncbi:MAG: metallophosphoesterase [Balneolaceae bacterium]
MPWTLRMTLIITAMTTIFLIYHYLRFSWSVRVTSLQPKKIYKRSFGLMVFLFLLYPLSGIFSHYILGDFSIDDFPRWMIWLFWYGFVFSAVMLTWMIILDVSRLIIKYAGKVKNPQLDTLFGWLTIGTMGIVLIFTAIGVMWDSNRIVIERIDHQTESTSALVDPLQIIHITDLHADRFTTEKDLETYIQKVNDENPDLIIFTGDLITSGMAHVSAGADALRRIESTYGVYAVLGDHDYWSGEEEITQAFADRGITMLRNENVWIDHGNQSIKLTGVTKIYSTSVSDEELNGLVSEDNEETFRILFSHQATDDLISIGQETGYDQLLAGHTHGGQIRIPVFFQKLTASQRESPYVIGYWWFDDMLLNINSGLGYTLAPIRYNAPAEVSVIEVN